MNQMQRAVAFLDLLGFSAAVEVDTERALSLLEGYSSILELTHFDRNLGNPNARGLEKRFLERWARLTTVLPCSDSMFVASDDVSDLVFGVAWLLAESFTFYSRHSASVQLPVLFRGGIASGTFYELQQPSIQSGRLVRTANVIGTGVVSAVQAEKGVEAAGENGLKGPRVWVTRDLAAAIDPEVRYLVEPAPDSPEMYDLLWPRATFFGLDMRFDRLAAMDYVRVAREGQALYRDIEKVEAHYRGLLELGVRSLRLRGRDDIEIEEWIRQSGLAM